MNSNFNIVLGVNLDDKSLGDVKGKIKNAFSGLNIDVGKFKNFDGLAAIKNDANEVVKYVGSINDGFDSIGFTMDKNLQKVLKYNAVAGQAYEAITDFQKVVASIEQNGLQTADVYNGKVNIKRMLRVYDTDTVKTLVHGIAGDAFGSFFKDDHDFDDYIKSKQKEIIAQGGHILDSYDDLRDNIRNKRVELENAISGISSDGFSGTLQEATDSVKKLREEFVQSVSNMASGAGLSGDVQNIQGDIGAWIGEQVNGIDQQVDNLITSLNDKNNAVESALASFSNSVRTAQGNITKRISTMDTSKVEEYLENSTRKARVNLEKTLSGLGISDAEINRVMAEAEAKLQTAKTNIISKINNNTGASSDNGNNIGNIGENAKKSAQSTSDAASQMNDSADKMQDAAEKTRKAAEEYNRANEELDDARGGGFGGSGGSGGGGRGGRGGRGGKVGRGGGRNGGSGDSDESAGMNWGFVPLNTEIEAIKNLIAAKVEVENQWDIVKTTITRNFDQNGNYDRINASVLLLNKDLKTTAERMYTIEGITSEAEIRMEDLRQTSEKTMKTFNSKGQSNIDPKLLQDAARQKIATARAGVPEAILGSDEVSKQFQQIESGISNITNQASLKAFQVQLQIIRDKIQEIKKQTGGDKFDPLAGMDKTVNELPAGLAKVEAAYSKLYNKNVSTKKGGSLLSGLYADTRDAVNVAIATWNDETKNADEKVNAIKKAREAVTLLNREVGAASRSVDELLESTHQAVSDNIINPSASGLESIYENLKNKIKQEKAANGGKLSPGAQQDIREEIKSYKKLYDSKLTEQRKYNNQIQGLIKSTEKQTQKANGYDQKSRRYAQENLKIRQKQVDVENLIAEARQKGLISWEQEQNYRKQLNDAVQNQNASNTPELNQFDKLKSNYDKLQKSIGDVKMKFSGDTTVSNFWDSASDAAKSYYETVERAKENLLADPNQNNVSAYKTANDNLQNYIDSINNLISIYPKLTSIQSQFNPANLIADANNMFVRSGRLNYISPVVDAYKGDISNLDQLLQKISNYDFEKGNVEDYISKVQEIITVYDRVGSAGKILKEQTDAIFQRSQGITGYQSILQDYGTYMSKFGASISSNDMLFEKFFKFREQLNKPLENFTGPDQAKRTFEELQAAAKRCGVEVESVRKRVGALIDRFSFAAVMASAIGYASRMMRQMYQNVIEVDTALVELKKVTDASDNSMSRFLDNASKRAKELGVTLSDLTNATAAFARMGYSIADSTVLGEQASIFRNVGDDVDSIDDATSIMISTMKAFGIEAENVSSIIDKLNEVSNTYAITSGGIGNALTRSASAAFSAGNTLDQTIAMITAANQVVDVCHHI